MILSLLKFCLANYGTEWTHEILHRNLICKVVCCASTAKHIFCCFAWESTASLFKTKQKLHFAMCYHCEGHIRASRLYLWLGPVKNMALCWAWALEKPHIFIWILDHFSIVRPRKKDLKLQGGRGEWEQGSKAGRGLGRGREETECSRGRKEQGCLTCK